MAVKPIHSGNGAMQLDWSGKILYAFFPQTPLITRILKKGAAGSRRDHDLNWTNMAGSTLVYRIARVIKTITISDFMERGSSEKSNPANIY